MNLLGAPVVQIALVKERVNALLPATWEIAVDGEDGQQLVDRRRPRSLIWSIAEEADGRLWLHVSVARRDHMPTWDDVVDAKELVIGTDREAYQVLPPRSRWVNQHPNCLHVFALVSDDDDGAVLPDFTRGGRSL